MDLHEYAIRRLLGTIPKLLLITLVVFLMMHATPGNPVDAFAPDRATPEQVEEIKEKYGLDQPLHIQYGKWLWNVAHGDFGQSIITGEPVAQMIQYRLPITLRFTLLGLVLSYAIAIPAGIVSALKQRTMTDYTVMGFVLLGVSFPSFWFGIILLMIFGIQLEWVALSGYGTLGLLLLPAFALGIRGSAVEARVMRSSMLETLNENFIRAARANGLPERSVLLKHGLRNALIPIITLFGLRIGWVLASGVVLEIVFSRPGVGKLMVDSIFRRDYPVVQAVLLILATAIMLGNLFADLLYSIVDPRIRFD